MSKFDSTKFNFDGMYLSYGEARRFVARFKYTKDSAAFKSFLVKNFEVDEYFGLLENCRIPPLKALESKGYVSPTVKRVLKSLGYSQDAAGKAKYLADSAFPRQNLQSYIQEF